MPGIFIILFMAFLQSPELPVAPQRIISLVPSQTELLFDLGLNDKVVGITKFCIHPEEWYHSKQRIGGTKTLEIKMIMDLKPDLVIANKEENTREQVEEIAAHYPVWLTDVNDLDDALQMLDNVGRLTHTLETALKIQQNIILEFQLLPVPISYVTAAYLIWKDPYMAAGQETFINDMLNRAGFKNVTAAGSRYPEVNLADLENSGCQVLLLSSEPYPFKEKHEQILKDHFPGLPTFLVDGELFSWYGSRLLKAPSYFKQLFKDVQEMLRQENTSKDLS